jgi:hypothetical protein
LCSLLLAAAALRVVAQVAVRPALFFYGDSFSYLANANHLQPEPIRPAGYPALLRVLLQAHDLAVVPAVQHVFGLAIGVLVYALMRRLGVGAVAGCVAAAPVLLDAYVLDLEQHILSEALFMLLVTAGLAIILWRPRPAVGACVAAGALLAAAALTRTVGLALIAPPLVFVAVRSGGLRPAALRTAVLAAAFAVPLAGYAAWAATVPGGSFSLTSHDGYFLYGRVADFASCEGIHLTRGERAVVCDPRPPGERPNPNYYVWHQWTRLRDPAFPRRPSRRNAVLESFALQVIRHQPLTYVRTVVQDMAHYADPGRFTGPRDEPVREWQFRIPPHSSAAQIARVQREVAYWGGVSGTSVPLVHALARYQGIGYTPGPVLAAAVLLALAGAAAGGLGGRRRPIRAETLVLASSGVLIPLVAAMTSMFDYRYLLPALPLLPAAGVLGASLLAARMRALRPALTTAR